VNPPPKPGMAAAGRGRTQNPKRIAKYVLLLFFEGWFVWRENLTPPPRHVNNLSEKDFFAESICDRTKWPKDVGGYIREVHLSEK